MSAPRLRAPDIACREGLSEYDVRWAWNDGPLEPGLTCVFRVKNEARNLPWVLPRMLAAVDRVVLVDNESDDGTLEVARRLAEEAGAGERFTATSYPFQVSRAGAEHLATPADSVHSLTHFYNWSFSHVRTSYSMKWDGDMVLTDEGVAALRDLSWQLRDSETIVVVPRHPLTVVDERTGWIDVAAGFREPWVYPMGPDHTFLKAFEWELRDYPEDTTEKLVLPQGLCVELKWLDADEFSHWTDPQEFAGSRVPRKQREWEVDRAIREGRAESFDGLVRIDAPPGVHLVDHVVHTWLPQAPRPLIGSHRRAAVPAPAPEPAPQRPGGSVSKFFSSAVRRAQAVVQPDGPGAGPAGDPSGAPASSPQRSGDLLAQALDDAVRPVLVLLHEELVGLADRIPESAQVQVLPATEVPKGGRWGTVLLCAPDREGLRRAASALPETRGTRWVGAWLAYAEQPVVLTPRADWPPLLEMQVRHEAGQALLLAHFGDAIPGHRRTVPGRRFLAELGRQAARGDVAGTHGLHVAVHGDATALPADVSSMRVADLADAADAELVVPPDLVLSDGPGDGPLASHPVIDRAPFVLDRSAGPLAIGPLDEHVLNPIGFERVVEGPLAELGVVDGRLQVRAGDDDPLPVDGRRGATDQLVARLRPALGLRVDWPASTDAGLARTVAGLAMAGIPLLTDVVPAWAGELLGGAVAAALAAPVDLGDRLSREEHSIVLRRAALGEFSSRAWRHRVAHAAGLRIASPASVSVVLATKRADQVEFAVRQVARQRGADLELVLAPHGFTVDEARLRDLAGDLRLTVLPQPGEAFFGDVLTRAVDASSGDLVLKMDDDDWYGPDFVSDLLLARSYSGAQLVGVPFEFVYLGPRDLTVRRHKPAERYTDSVAGGSMMIERGLLRTLGSFRQVRKHVDAALIEDVIGAGADIYRTHGLNYLFRRGEAGHTWDSDVEAFLEPKQLTGKWDGFRPSRLLEVDAADRP